jgi:hypothetical protein
MQGNMPAFGPFPEVTLDQVPEWMKTEDMTLPVEIGTYTLNAENKIVLGAGDGLTVPGGKPNPKLAEVWNKKGDKSDVGFGVLMTVEWGNTKSLAMGKYKNRQIASREGWSRRQQGQQKRFYSAVSCLAIGGTKSRRIASREGWRRRQRSQQRR